MKGIVSRDLKPGNVLVRSDGHIVLTDFDLFEMPVGGPLPALPPQAQPKPKRKIKIKKSALEFVAEPTDARCLHFIVRLSAVDWWTLGIFLFELPYGMTPFKGLDKDLISQLRIKDPASEFGSSSMYTPAAI